LAGESVTVLAHDEAQAGVDGVKIKEISVAGLPSAAVEGVKRAADRAMRDERILQLFFAAVTYRADREGGGIALAAERVRGGSSGARTGARAVNR
jgi:hypothetical protein